MKKRASRGEETKRFHQIGTPLGAMTAEANEGALTWLSFGFGGRSTRPDGLLRRVERELQEYFAGRRRRFTIPLRPEGTPFRRAVWEAMTRIPHGRTVSYGEIARRIGRPRAVRAVGQACGANPIAIVIPCHRVVGSDRSLTGFSAGIGRKRRLLQLEGSVDVRS